MCSLIMAGISVGQTFSTFTDASKESWQQVSVVIIDKDFTEHKVLKEEFPEAVILYCQWHVIKALFKANVTMILIKMTERYSVI